MVRSAILTTLLATEHGTRSRQVMVAIAAPMTPRNCVITPTSAFGSSVLRQPVPTHSNGSMYRRRRLTTTTRSFILRWTFLKRLLPRQVLHFGCRTIAEIIGRKLILVVRPVRNLRPEAL